MINKYVDDHGFANSGRGGGMSQRKEAKLFSGAIKRQSALQQKDTLLISVFSRRNRHMSFGC
jgi:hypothetical protein